MVRAYCCIILLCLCSCTGCSGGKPDLVPVSGQVLIDGEPLQSGFVRFSPGEGRVSMGRIGEDGQFNLTCYEPGDGAIVGTHRVAVLAHEVVGPGKIKWHAPRKYSSYGTSGLSETITEQTDSLVINLTWDGESRRK